MRSRKGKRREEETDFELNIASIIDCFTVLITYLLVSASFISLTAMDVTPDVPGMSQSDEKDPSVFVSIELRDDHKLKLVLSGAVKQTVDLAAKENGWDLDQLKELLNALKAKYPDVKSAMVAAKDEVEYQEVVKVIEAAKKSLPQVTLGDLAS